ncbi:MAG: sugar transferase [Planctomycetes bacterium]|nr:sugar transferase [Planctomycetota bacterium]
MTVAGRAIKRVMDVALSGLALLVGWPALAVMAILIRRDSPGPAIFRQERAGRGMKPFTMYKFRTMRVDADPFGVSPDGAGDPRLTPVGRRLREASLDELPQLWNVFRGHMSLVGPRPLYMSQAREFDARQRRRLEVRPGLTGLAQVQGRGELPHAEKLEIDVQYVEKMSFGLDLRILWRTAFGRRRGDVYQKW